ncbi:hypothetical protein [Streptomyces sp. NPDC048489]|uniref:hypothetical protein n=1 Tax=Streptomyces sp. NPDC048489 TaxID=3154504 RepID=UPI00343BC9FD
MAGKALKPDTRTAADMAAGAAGEWKSKTSKVVSKRARRAAVAGAPKAKFATINGERVEVRQARPKEARAYPSAPVNARPGSRVAAAMLRTPDRKPGEVKAVPSGVRERQYVAPLAFGDRHEPRALRVGMSKAESANALPFMPEFQAEGQSFPRMARDETGAVMPRVRTDNGMTEQLKGRGIGRREDGKPTYTKRQLDHMAAERQAEYAALMDQARYRQADQDAQDARKDAKRALQDALGRRRDALARDDKAAYMAAQADVNKYRKLARFSA